MGEAGKSPWTDPRRGALPEGSILEGLAELNTLRLGADGQASELEAVHTADLFLQHAGNRQPRGWVGRAGLWLGAGAPPKPSMASLVLQ